MESDSYSETESVGNQNNEIADDVNLPLAERLKRLSEQNSRNAFESVNNTHRKKKRNHDSENYTSDAAISHKNAPAVMPSNRPVKRLRIDANNVVQQFRDPRWLCYVYYLFAFLFAYLFTYHRFSSISGQLNDEKFAQSYRFLNDYQEKEVEILEKSLKKTKSDVKKDAIKDVLSKYVVCVYVYICYWASV